MSKYLEDMRSELRVIETASPKNRSVSGYGRKIPTRFPVVDGKILRRVYMICRANAGSAYVLIQGKKVFLRNEVLSDGCVLR